MDTGMLWFDDGPQVLKDKVARAVSFYATKYGRTPTVCLVHPATTGGTEIGAGSGGGPREGRPSPPPPWWGSRSCRRARRRRSGRARRAKRSPGQSGEEAEALRAARPPEAR